MTALPVANIGEFCKINQFLWMYLSKHFYWLTICHDQRTDAMTINLEPEEARCFCELMDLFANQHEVEPPLPASRRRQATPGNLLPPDKLQQYMQVLAKVIGQLPKAE